MRVRSVHPALWVVLALGLSAAPGIALPSDEAGEIASRYAAQVNAFLPLLGDRADPLLLATALPEIRRAVAEIDRIVASVPPPGPGAADPGSVHGIAAAAHLHLAAFETLGRDFEGARRNVDRARQLLGAGAGAVLLPWAVRQDGGPGLAPVTYSELLPAAEIESLLRAAWSEIRPVAFDLGTVDADDLSALVLSGSPGSACRESDRPLVEAGARLFGDMVASGGRSFSIPLPPGTYLVRGRAGAGLDRDFLVPEVSGTDPVVIGAQRFALRLEVAGRAHTPRLFLNGMQVRDTSAMPYGVYRVEADREVLGDAPELIRFVPGAGSDEKSRTAWTVHVPAGGLIELRFGVAALGNPLWN